MKLTNWQVITLVAILLAAIIVANIFAPGAVAIVTSVVSTATALFVERQKTPEASDAKEGAS